jgi:hypothetical protein
MSTGILALRTEFSGPANALPDNGDKITTISKDKIGQRIGRLGDEDVARLNRAPEPFSISAH